MKTTPEDIIKELLCQHLGMSELDYEMMVFETAYEYLDRLVGSNPVVVNMLAYSSIFWVWWKNQWDRRNRILVHDTQLNNVSHIISPDVRMLLNEVFMNTHRVGSMKVYPGRVVLKEVCSLTVKKHENEQKAI